MGVTAQADRWGWGVSERSSTRSILSPRAPSGIHEPSYGLGSLTLNVVRSSWNQNPSETPGHGTSRAAAERALKDIRLVRGLLEEAAST
jgi:hypothetical protein